MLSFMHIMHDLDVYYRWFDSDVIDIYKRVKDVIIVCITWYVAMVFASVNLPQTKSSNSDRVILASG